MWVSSKMPEVVKRFADKSNTSDNNQGWRLRTNHIVKKDRSKAKQKQLKLPFEKCNK